MKCDTPMTFEEAKAMLGIVDSKPIKMTNEEYLRSCNTEQLADVLAKQKCDGCNDEPYDEEHSTCKYCMMQKREQIMEWLKQPHTITKE